MTEFTQVATIPKTAQRCKAEGIGLSENQLRTLCARGELKHTQMGTDLLAQPLRAAGAGTPQEEAPVVYGKIRRIAE